MPKGSKKRKASKKKAHHHHHQHNHDDAPHSSHTNGDNETKHHEDKDSDGEEGNSPTSQDNHNSQLDLTDGEKEERGKVDDRPHSPSSSDDSQSVDESTVHPEVVPVTVEVGDGGVDEELKSEEQSYGEPQNVEVVYNNSVSSQQPDDESAYNDVKATHELKEGTSNDVPVELVKESGDEFLEKSSPVEKIAASEEDEAPLISSYEPVNALPKALPPATDAIFADEKSDAAQQNGSVSEVDKVAFPDEKSNGDSIASGASVKVEDVTVSRTTGNGKQEAISLERGVDTPPVDLGSQKEGDATNIALPDSVSSASPLTEGNPTHSKNVTTSDVRNSADQKKDIEVSESSVREPLLAARPQPRTSWLSCCGLFEAFGGSSR